mmetsp:Transcript_89905/g.279816  ORF Transcript_89905/g.279816 Transcript_89905/m.279816 type:complete len:356 (-) Transcript_89905:277-1344(-)
MRERTRKNPRAHACARLRWRGQLVPGVSGGAGPCGRGRERKSRRPTGGGARGSRKSPSPPGPSPRRSESACRNGRRRSCCSPAARPTCPRGAPRAPRRRRSSSPRRRACASRPCGRQRPRGTGPGRASGSHPRWTRGRCPPAPRRSGRRATTLPRAPPRPSSRKGHPRRRAPPQRRPGPRRPRTGAPARRRPPLPTEALWQRCQGQHGPAGLPQEVGEIDEHEVVLEQPLPRPGDARTVEVRDSECHPLARRRDAEELALPEGLAVGRRRGVIARAEEEHLREAGHGEGRPVLALLAAEAPVAQRARAREAHGVVDEALREPLAHVPELGLPVVEARPVHEVLVEAAHEALCHRL